MTKQSNTESTRNLHGTVKWFDPTKGFGFILPSEGGPDILLHANVLRNFGQSSVADGALVEIEVLETERGLQAVEVTGITPPAHMSEAGSDVPAGIDLPDLGDYTLEPARIKWFDKGKGFGFANVFGSTEDVFVHVEILRRSGLSDLQAGEAICLAAEDGARGRMAVLVKPWDSMVEADQD